jgi:WD40 repeat protein
MTVLSAGALAQVVADEPGSGPVVAASVGVIGGTTCKVLSDVISSTVDQLRDEGCDSLAAADVERELAAGIEAVLAEGEPDAVALRKEIATLLRVTDAARHAVRAAAEAEDDDLQPSVVAAFGKLADEFPEFRFLLTQASDTADPDAQPAAGLAERRRPAVMVGGQRRSRLLVGATVTVLVLALIATGVAVRATLIASEQRDLALARQLVAESQTLAPSDPSRSQLLAAAAWRIAPSPQARTGLLRALAHSARRVTVGGAVAFSPDSEVLATGAPDGAVRLWDTGTGQSVDTFDAGGPVSAVAFGRDGIVAGGSTDGKSWLWNSATGEQTPVRSRLPEITVMAFNPDGAKLVAGGDKGRIELWDAVKRRSVKVWDKHGGRIDVVAFSPGGVVATGARDGRVALRDTRTGKGRLLPSRGDFTGGSDDGRRVTALAFNPDGTVLADGGPNGIVRLWSARTGKAITSFPAARGAVSALAYSPDGAILAAAGSDGTVGLWDTATLRHILTLAGQPTVSTLVFSPDGTRLASGGDMARLWDNPIGRRVATPGDIPADVPTVEPRRRDVALSADGGILAVAGAEKSGIAVSDTGNQKQRAVVTAEPGSAVRPPLALSPDGSLLAIGGGAAGVRLWDTRTGRHVRALTGPSELNTLTFGPNGILAGGGIQGRVWLWNSVSGRKIRVLRVGESGVGALRFTPDGTVLATSTWSGEVWQRYTDTGNLINKVPGAGFGDSALAYSPDGTVLAQSTPDGPVRLLHAASGDRIATLHGHQGTVNAVVFGSGGHTVVSGGADGTVRLWDAASGEPVMDLKGQAAPVLALALRSDGTLISVGADNSIRSWDLSYLRNPYEALCDRVGRTLSRSEWQHHMPDVPYQDVCPQG